MDLLHLKLVEGFCIVSSDSDYTGLAHRIREEGLFIMGIGKRHTPEAFIKACESFTYSEILPTRPSLPAATSSNDSTSSSSSDPAASLKPLAVDYALVNRAFRIAMNVDTGKTYLAHFASELRKLDPSFDHRNFGFSTLRKFCESGAMKAKYELTMLKGGMLIEEKQLPSDN
jgi:NYN domain/OST-HTH/LOTUS domain